MDKIQELIKDIERDTVGKVCLNPSNTYYTNEAVIDVFASSLGQYCGSFSVRKGQEYEIIRALNAVKDSGRIFITRAATDAK